jgi:hypothetical protein
MSLSYSPSAVADGVAHRFLIREDSGVFLVNHASQLMAWQIGKHRKQFIYDF